MRVSVIGTRGFPGIQGGVEKHCESLYSAMPDAVDITIYRRKPYVDKAMDAPGRNIRFIDLPSTRIKGVESFLHSFLASCIAATSKTEIVHFHNIGPAFFAPLVKLFGKKVVLTFHSPNYEHDKWGKLAKLLLRFSEKVALRFSDSIIFVNRYQMEKYAPAVLRKSVYIPNGIPRVSRSSSVEYITSLGLESGKYILAVGRITPEKGFDVLIKAYNALGQADIPLVIAGSVESELGYGRDLKILANGGNIVFPGFVQGEPLRQLYSHARLFVLSSINEGFPLVLLEAMAYGLDVLVSDIPAAHLVHLPESDYFFAGDTASLTRKLQERISVSEGYVSYDLKDFDWQDIALKVFETYERTLESPDCQ